MVKTVEELIKSVMWKTDEDYNMSKNLYQYLQ